MYIKTKLDDLDCVAVMELLPVEVVVVLVMACDVLEAVLKVLVLALVLVLGVVVIFMLELVVILVMGVEVLVVSIQQSP